MQQRSSKLNSTCGGMLLQLGIGVTRRLEDKTSTGLKGDLMPLDEALSILRVFERVTSSDGYGECSPRPSWASAGAAL